MKNILTVLLSVAAVFLTASCTADITSETLDYPTENNSSSMQFEQENAAKNTALNPAEDELSKTFCEFFQSHWMSVEGAADHFALPEGTVFFLDLNCDDIPELYITYSTGGGKQTGIIAYDVSGTQPVELGSAYLAVAPEGQDVLQFTIWGDQKQRVLYTLGEIPHGAVDKSHYFIESFLTLTNGQLTGEELNYHVSEDGKTTYYKGPPENEPLTKNSYEQLRQAYLLSNEPLETVNAGEIIHFMEDKDRFIKRLCTALADWQQNHREDKSFD